MKPLNEKMREAVKNATRCWASFERNPHSIAREFEIREPFGGILFRSTSYGKMQEDAEYIELVNPQNIAILLSALDTYRDALNKIHDLPASAWIHDVCLQTKVDVERALE